VNAFSPDITFDLATSPLRDLNEALHKTSGESNARRWRVLNPEGRHAVAVGIDAPVTVEIDGNVGYYCAGMNQNASVIIHGNAGQGVAENMMSGFVRVCGDASQSAGATGHGGLLVVDGNASARCGISMKGIDIVVKGSIGHMSAFMGQSGSLIVFGDAGEALGDSLYEAKLFVRGTVKSLGADCIAKELRDEHKALLAQKLEAAGVAPGSVDLSEFKRYGSARKLYNFHVDNADAY
jgi:glutamate synthase domain-containing protein 3